MFFKGTERRGCAAIAQEIQALGGYVNAYTTFNRTVYWIDGVSENVDGYLDILADMVREPLPAPERPGRGARRGGDDWATVHALDVPPGAPSRGAADAPIVVQVFSDFQCPYCAQVEPTLESLRAHYRERLRIVWRDFPLPRHPDAMPAAEAAREALAQRGDEGFWRYHDAIFAHASDEDGLARAALERLARAQGLDLARFRQALDDHRHVAAIRADMAAATATGARLATPAFFINGHFMSGAQPLTEFIARIDGLAR
jgi:protein-disulfide isomerase